YPTKLTKAILRDVDKQKNLAETFEKSDEVTEVPDPIELPDITDVELTYTFGGSSPITGKLTWTGSDDDRIVYRIYRETPHIDERIGEVKGKTEFMID